MKIWFNFGYNFYQDDMDTKFLFGTAYRTWSNDHKRYTYKGLTLEFFFFKYVISFNYVDHGDVYLHYRRERAEKHKVWKNRLESWRTEYESKNKKTDS